MKSFVKKNWILAVLLILVSAVFFYFGRAKAGFFIDEIHSYGLSNSHYAPYISDAVGGSLEDTVISRDQLIEYATVNDGEILDFGSVYYNQEKDVHPPLFYFLFNTVSSLVGTNFSKWTGLILNYVILIGTLLVLYKLCAELFEDNKSAPLCAVVLYGISTMGISTALYIRMYMLLTFFTVLLAFFALKLIKTDNVKYCSHIGVTIMLGLLTQYYFVFYAFFLCAALCIYYIKKPKMLASVALFSLAGVGLMVLLFPACISHIFVGNGMVVGGTSVTEAVADTSRYGERLNTFVHFMTYGLKAAIFCGCLAIIVYRKLKYRSEVLILVLPAVLAWAVAAIVSPVFEERYVYNLAPIFVLLAAWFIKDDIKALPVCIAACLVCLAVSTPNNLFSQHLEYNEILQDYSDCPCVYLQDNRFEGLTYDFGQLLIFDSVYATDSAEKAAEYIKDADCAVVFIDEDAFWSSGFKPEELLPELEQYSGYTQYEQLYTNGFSGVYLISKGAA